MQNYKKVLPKSIKKTHGSSLLHFNWLVSKFKACNIN